SVGVVYGDLGTSPLYMWPSIFSSAPSEEDVIGALSLVLWTLTLIVVIKYVAIVLNANDHGEGGTFAIYSLFCRYAKINPIGAVEASDKTLRRYSTSQRRLMEMTKGISLALERHAWLRTCLLMLVLLGTCALVGDGILTPAISVVSAVSGLQVPASLLDDSGLPKISNGAVVGISCAIMVLIFGGQRFGTSKIGFAYAPVLFLWFLSNAAVGLYNIATAYPAILKAFALACSPHYIFTYFIRNGLTGWESLGGIVLAITDMLRLLLQQYLGHFSKGTIRLSALGVVYPSLLVIYLGQAAYLVAHPDSYSSLYYSAQPTAVYWPMFVIAILASIVASQSIVTGTFSIISQSMTLDCFPRVRIVHTSAKVKGQIYIPEINWILLTIGIALILGFTLTQPASSPVNTAQLGNAFGVAVLSVMLVTTVLVSLVMLVVWEKPLALVLPFFLFFFIFEGVYFTANIRKAPQVPTGAWFPLALAAVVMAISCTWHWALNLKYPKTKNSNRHAQVLSTGVTVPRQPGVAVYYSDSLRGLPPIFEQLLSTAPVLHKLIIFLHIRQA
ncbi:potassium transporter, partial [Coccomyxa subellipsoidea C-169]